MSDSVSDAGPEAYPGIAGIPEPAAAQLEEGRLLFAKPCAFVTGAAKPEQIPATSLPEIAFAGRSNVGKSSLINALTGHKALTRTSNTPGRTQEVNFFDLHGRLMIADLPGFGYAKAAKTRIRQWTHLVNTYLKGRAVLRRVCLLVDARHGLKPGDRDVMTMLDQAAVNYQIVLTKVDKIRAPARDELVSGIRAETRQYTALHPQTIATSSRKGIGIACLRATLAQLALSVEEARSP